MPSLLMELSRDHVSVATLARLYGEHRGSTGFARDALAALEQLDADHAYRAVWLLRKAARDARLTPAHWAALTALSDGSDHWLFRLTLCQLFSEPTCSPAVRAQVFPFLQQCFSDRRTIVRAWALTSMTALRENPAYRDVVAQSWRAAARDPSKSMQARLRLLRATRISRKSNARAKERQRAPD